MRSRASRKGRLAACILDRLGLAGDDHLAGGVGVGQEHLADLAADVAAELADGLVGQAEDDPHHPGAAGLVGQLGPADDQLQALLEADPAGGEQGRVLAEGVAGDQVGAQALLAGQEVAGGRVDVDGRLGLAGVGQGGVARFQDLDHVPAEDLGGPDERPAGGVTGPGGAAVLGDAALAGEGEGDLFHRARILRGRAHKQMTDGYDPLPAATVTLDGNLVQARQEDACSITFPAQASGCAAPPVAT
jgi:hypothetical protein